MDGLERYYAKWNKPDRERQILDDITDMWNLKKYNKLVNITKKENHRYREQTNCYQWGKGMGEEQYQGGEIRGTNYYV